MHKLIIIVVMLALVIGGILLWSRNAQVDGTGDASISSSITTFIKKKIIRSNEMNIPQKKQQNPGRTEVAN